MASIGAASRGATSTVRRSGAVFSLRILRRRLVASVRSTSKDHGGLVDEFGDYAHFSEKFVLYRVVLNDSGQALVDHTSKLWWKIEEPKRLRGRHRSGTVCAIEQGFSGEPGKWENIESMWEALV